MKTKTNTQAIREESEMLTLDGSMGEGGGQILRTSLGLSLVTGKPFRIERIRAGRKKPGLMRQHLTAVQAATQISHAQVEGDRIGSQELVFIPGVVQSGQYEFAVGTAGSTTLVLQTILPALIKAQQETSLVLKGGTHNPYAPPFDFLVKSFLPILNQMGACVQAELKKPGFYPAGGGELAVKVKPCSRLVPMELLERGDIKQRLATAIVARLPETIAKRELSVVRRKLDWGADAFKVNRYEQSPGPGNVMTLEIESEHVTEVFTGFGVKGLSAEKVPLAAIKQVRDYLVAEVPVGQYLADQLIIPMAMAGSGRFRTLPLSQHTRTNIEVVKRFLDVNIDVRQIENNVFEIQVS